MSGRDETAGLGAPDLAETVCETHSDSPELRDPRETTVEIPAGEVFLLEVPGHRQLQQTRMEFRRFEEGYGEYYCADRYHLADGLRAAFLPVAPLQRRRRSPLP